MPQHTKSISLTTSAGQLSGTPRTYNAEAEINIDLAFTSAQTNTAVVCNLDVSQLKSIFILANTACTIKTNSTTSPDATITLVSDVPYSGDTDNTGPITALSADVTTLYVTMASTSGGTLKIRALQDPTV